MPLYPSCLLCWDNSRAKIRCYAFHVPLLGPQSRVLNSSWGSLQRAFCERVELGSAWAAAGHVRGSALARSHLLWTKVIVCFHDMEAV